MIYAYPPEVHDFVRENCTKMRDSELAEACNKALGTEFTTNKMKTFRGNHGYKNGFPQHYTKEEYWARQKKWPKGMYEYIRDNSWGVPSKEMAERVKDLFGVEISAHNMKQFRQRHGIKSGVAGWYQKGHDPGNKGKKIDEYMSPEAAAKVRQTSFKKGHRPKNEKPVGTEVVNAYSDGYRIRKKQTEGKQNERWEFVHRAVWEEHNGPIPKGMCIVFKDGDKMNCDISNLALISRGELAVMNHRGYFSECPEATEAGINLVRIGNRIKEVKKRRTGRGG